MRVRRYVTADHRSPPRSSVTVLHALPVFHEASSVEYGPSSRSKPSPIAVGDLRLSGAVRTSTTSSVSFAPCGEPRLVLKHRFFVFHCHHVLFCARASNCRNDRAAPARLWSLFVPWTGLLEQ